MEAIQTGIKVNYNPFEQGPIEIGAPSTNAQREIWSSLQMDEHATLCYNESICLELNGYVNTDYLRDSLLDLVDRHDALKMVFSKDGSMVSYLGIDKTSITFIDIADNEKRDEQVTKISEREVLTPFDLVNGPCFRATIVRYSSEKTLVFLSSHHIVCDGWSFGVILKELGMIYTAKVNAVSSELEIAPSFFEYSSLIQEDHNHEMYWRKEFSELKDKNFPTDFERPRYRSFKSKRIDFQIPETTVASLKKLSVSEKCSFYNTLITAFNLILSQLNQSDETVIGLASAHQAVIGEFGLVGHLVNLLPLKTTIPKNATLKEYLQIVKNKMIDAFEHQTFSYGSIVHACSHLERKTGETPLLNVVFNIDQQLRPSELKFGTVTATYRTIPREFENFDIFINAVSGGNSLVLECQYNSELFSVSTITKWLQFYAELLTQLVDLRDQSIDKIDFNLLYRPQIKETFEPKLVQERIFEREETIISKVWSDVLVLKEIKGSDHFFALGGHSLLAIEVVRRLNLEFQTQLQMKDIFQFPTVRELAQRVHEQTQVPTKKKSLIIPSSEKMNSEVGMNQYQIWFLEEALPNTTMHNLPSALRLKTNVDVQALERALNILINRHPAMRTSFKMENSIVQQYIHASEDIKYKLEHIHCTEVALEPLLTSAAAHVFDKSKAPLFVAKLYELSPNDFVLFFMVHHAIWDGWSFDIFFEELDIAYRAAKNFETPKFPSNPSINFIDYSLWLQSQIKNGELEGELHYWKNKLSTPLPVLNLPLDFNRPMETAHVGEMIPFTLTEHQSYLVREYAKLHGSSLFSVFLTAFKVTLALHDSDLREKGDIIVGLPVRGRTNEAVMGTVGYFVNTIALRTKFDTQKTFEEYLKIVSQESQEAFEHQLLPFQLILNDLKLPRDASRTPVFQAFFSFQDISNRKAEFDQTSYSQINVSKCSTHTDLDLWIKASASKIEGAFEFRQDLFQRITVERFRDVFIHLLDHLMENLQKPLKNLDVLPKQHKDVLLNEWNSTKIKRSFISVPELVREQAKKFSNMIAVETSDERCSYLELELRSHKLATALRRRGVKKGDIVGVCLNRESNLLVSLLGILKLGAAYLPLDPYFPTDRLSYMIEDAKPRLVICHSGAENSFSSEGTVTIDELVHDHSLETKFNQLETIHPHDLMYVIYTSGSTGKPKGVQLTHGNVFNFLLAMQEKGLSSSQMKLLAVTTLSFDIAVLELYLPLISGGTVVLAQPQQVVDGNALKYLMLEKQITHLQATPSTWKLLLSNGWQGDKNLIALCGGESFPLDLKRALVPVCKEVWNMYGPTETTVWSACKKLNISEEKITIGRPIANTEIFIVDQQQQLLPIGAVGEIAIAGDGLALGYKNREDLTSEKFVSHPFHHGKKMYLTGDLGRWTFDGEIQCLGRNDSQIKLRGYRIELGEIENQLLKIDGVKEAAVIVKEVRGDKRLVAYLSFKADSTEDKVLRESLLKHIPAYMVPSHFVPMKELPKTLNGKIDRKTLPDFTFNDVVEKNPVEDIMSETETILLKSFKEVLALDNLKVSDNFFDVGGHSMLALTLVAKINEHFKIQLPLSCFIKTPTIRGIAQTLSAPVRTVTHDLDFPPVLRSLIPLRKFGEKTPILLFHGVGGNVLNYVPLVSSLPEGHPVFAFQSLGLDGISPILNDVAEMAKNYVHELLLVKPRGPYILAGGSMGGLVALEVAQILKQRGEIVEKLIMLDTFGPNLHLENYEKHIGSGLTRRIYNALKYRKRLLITNIQCAFHRSMGGVVPLPLLIKQIERENYKAIWKYKPLTYSGELYLIRSNSAFGWYSDPVMGWKGIIKGDIKTFRIEGGHSDFIEAPQLSTVLAQLI